MNDQADEQIVGIDLGTTYSLVAALVDGRPTLIPNGLGELLTPSAVSLGEDGRLLVGAPARARATTHPEVTVQAFKRDMGTDRTWELGGMDLTPLQLSAAVLATLKEDAEAFLGHPVTEAVVTVPAYFGDSQRQATQDAGELAGLLVERIINEPTSAALAYGLNERHRDLRVAVLDLGGGTFDVTILEIIEGCIEVQSSAGDARLGGEDFVDTLEAIFTDWLAAEYGHRQALPAQAQARVRQACEVAKKRLTSNSEATMAVANLELGKKSMDVELLVTRAQAEKSWKPLLERIRHPVLRALRDSPFSAEDIDDVLLVGGATRMGCVVSLATELFGQLPRRDLPPEEAIALGAALQAGLKQGDAAIKDLVVTDVAPFTLGVDSAHRVGQRFVTDVFVPIIDRGTVIPTSRVQRFSTLSDYQTHIEVVIYQGEHARCGRNQRLGELLVGNLPSKPAGELEVDIRFTYDLNGILEVETTVVETGQKRKTVLQNREGALTAWELEAALQDMQQLKFHPRETLPNTTALARAEALFVTLTGDRRQALANAINDFRVLLEDQDPALIAEGRTRLVDLTQQLRE